MYYHIESLIYVILQLFSISILQSIKEKKYHYLPSFVSQNHAAAYKPTLKYQTLNLTKVLQEETNTIISHKQTRTSHT